MPTLVSLLRQQTILELRPDQDIFSHHWLVAYHEAGHAVVGQFCGYTIAEIDATGKLASHAEVRFSKYPPPPILRDDEAIFASNDFRLYQVRLITTLAGYESEKMHGRNYRRRFKIVKACPWPRQDIDDYRVAYDILSTLYKNPRFARFYFLAALQMTRALLRNPAIRLAIHDLAKVLYLFSTNGEPLPGKIVRSLIKNAFRYEMHGRKPEDEARRERYLRRQLR